MIRGYSYDWCGVCDATTEHIGIRCVVCDCATPLCPDCKAPLTLETDQDDSNNLNWSCDPCSIDYGRGRFRVPAHVLAVHRAFIADAARQQTEELERMKLEQWSTAMRGER